MPRSLYLDYFENVNVIVAGNGNFIFFQTQGCERTLMYNISHKSWQWTSDSGVVSQGIGQGKANGQMKQDLNSAPYGHSHTRQARYRPMVSTQVVPSLVAPGAYPTALSVKAAIPLFPTQQVVQPAVTVPMPGATPAAPSFGMRGSYNDYLSMPAGNMTSAYGRDSGGRADISGPCGTYQAFRWELSCYIVGSPFDRQWRQSGYQWTMWHISSLPMGA